MKHRTDAKKLKKTKQGTTHKYGGNMASFISRKNSPESSLAILSRIALADKTAAKECVDIYGAMIWSLARKFTDSREDAEKAVQEIFIDIWQNAEYCDLTTSDEEVWIALIARRRLSKYALSGKFQSQAKAANNVLYYQSDKTEKTEIRLPQAG